MSGTNSGERSSEDYEIRNALSDEMWVAVVGDNNTLIEVSIIGKNQLGEWVLETSCMTRASIGTCFYSFGDKDKAHLFNLEAESDFLAHKSKDPENSQQPSKPKPELMRTPQNKILEAVAPMALLLGKKTPKYRRGSKPNARQIASDVEALAVELYGLER